MPQFSRPSADTLLGNYVPEPPDGVGFTKIDEQVPDDADFITSPTNPAAAENVVKLSSVADPVSSLDHIYRIRVAKNTAGGQQIDWTWELIEGDPGVNKANVGTSAFVRATRSFVDESNTKITREIVLTGPEADSIGDYTNLYRRLAVSAA